MARGGRWFVVCGLLVAAPQAATPNPLFVQDFDGEVSWDSLNDSTLVYHPNAGDPKHRDWPHGKFNHIWGGPWSNAGLSTLGASGSSKSLVVTLQQGENYGKSISYYIGGNVRIVPDLLAFFSQPLPPAPPDNLGALVRDSYVSDSTLKEAYLRYYVMFSPTFNVRKGETGKIPGLAGTWRAGAGGMWPAVPDSLGWSARLC
jgi:hypothetical protein